MEIQAIIKSGGKQYKVSPGQVIKVDRLPIEEGSLTEITEVLMVADQGKVKVGNPFVEGAKVVAKSLSEEKGEKVMVFKYKPKVRYRKRRGHRQLFTKLAIERIEVKE
jgi:large subunit ribosomal protein L21